MSDMRTLPPPPGYWPPTPSQWTEVTVDDCTWFAGEFAWQSGSDIHRSMHPVDDLRAKSTDRVGGTPINVMMNEIDRLWPARDGVGWRYGSHSTQEIKRALTGGAAVIVGGDYEKLPPHYKRWTNNDVFDHAMTIKFLLDDGRVRLYDPLGGGPARLPYDGEWIPFEALFAGNYGFNWQEPTGAYPTGFVQNLTEGAPEVDKLFLDQEHPATREMRVKDRTPVYKKPSITSLRVKTFWNETVWRWLAGATEGWRITVYQDVGSTDWKVGYVNNIDVIETRTAELPADDHLETIETLTTQLNEERDQLATANGKIEAIRNLIAL